MTGCSRSTTGPLALFVIISAAAATNAPSHNFYQQCKLHCPLQNRTQDQQHFEVGCGADCEISQCLTGCALWEKALEVNCKTVCNGTEELLHPKELYCVMGCNDALNRYLQQLKDAYGIPPAPALVADSLTPTSLRLEWESDGYTKLRRLAQWRYEPLGSWEYARDQEWGPGPTVLISGLTPYTNYRFRVVVLSQEAELVSSEPSLVIGTLPEGPPSSPPAHLRATPTGPTRVSITWSSGPFPNGPLLSYVLSIQQLPSGYRAHKDIPASDKKNFYMFQSLTPSTNYSVSVAMRNAIGLGPTTSAVVTTPNPSQVKEKEKNILILGTRHSVLSQAADMLDEPMELYTSTHHIKGVSYHVRKGMVFVSDSAGRVLSVKDGAATQILSTELPPHDLSVDWLNDQLYVLLGQAGSRWQVTRCSLDGSAITVAVAGLLAKPLHIHVDPYNGYLFWLVQGSPGGGLYRLDLTDISNGIKHETSPDLILNNPSLGAFTVDYTNFRILVSSQEKNTVLAVSLDGREVTDFRSNTASPQFQKVVSLAMSDGLFYWTNGWDILSEEYHPGKDAYFHNLGGGGRGYLFVGVDSTAAQPLPVPVNPPTCLQAVLGTDHAAAAWASPHLLGGQGKGAWEEWEYRLSVEWEGGSATLDNIQGTRTAVTGLGPGSRVSLRVAAVGRGGARGPWSAPFQGLTLTRAPLLLWSAAGGLLGSDPTGQNLTNVLHTHHIQGRRREHIMDVAWLDDSLYLVTNSSSVILYNLTSKASRVLRGLEVGSIAVDWVGRRLYWSNPKQQLITRGSLNGSLQEPLPILTVAKELNIDAVNAFIYWSTGHAVECARLNGKQRRTYYPAELFSGKQVMGLTLDMDERSVYWIVRNYEGSTLFRAGMADGATHPTEIVPDKMSLVQYPDIQGPLCYFDSRLLWLRDDRNAVIGDLNGTNSALLNSMSLTGLNMVTVIDEALHPLPDVRSGEVSVIPCAVSADSIQVVGNFSHFNITWDPVTNINLGQIFYELKISHEDRKEIVAETVAPVWCWPSEEPPPPYSELRLSLKALTYWGSSPRVSLLLHSPQSVPSQPLRLRAFLIFTPTYFGSHPQSVEVRLRWVEPPAPNGQLSGYKVLSWLDGSSTYLWVSPLLTPSSTEFSTSEVPDNATVFFQVRACTELGCGLPSAAVRVETGRETPLPLLLMSTGEGLSLGDQDSGEARLLASQQGILSFAYDGDRVFYLDDRATISEVSLDTNHRGKVVSLNNTGLSLTLDWIGRALFWSEQGDRPGTSAIKRFDLTLFEQGVMEVTTLAERNSLVYSLQVDPNRGMIYWVEEKSNKFMYLMKCAINDCQEPSFFFEQQTEDNSECNCPKSPFPWPMFALDPASPRLFWIDAPTGNIRVSDLAACRCHLILDNFNGRHTGLPPSSLTVDLHYIYWSNETENRLYRLPKSNFSHSENVTFQPVPGLVKVFSFGRQLHPYPDVECMVPNEAPDSPELISKTNDSVTLLVSPSRRPHHCSSVSQPSSIYTFYYGSNGSDSVFGCGHHLNNCQIFESYHRRSRIGGLLPYTNYVFRVLESNFYLDLAGITPKLSLPAIHRTAPGAPSPAEDISVRALSPTEAEVHWGPPRQLNSWGVVRYEVAWRAQGLAGGARRSGEQVVRGGDDNTSARLRDLLPGQLYQISVRAYSENAETYSESESTEVAMFPEPPDLFLSEATAYTLNISWPTEWNTSIVSHDLEYVDLTSGEWKIISPSSYDDAEEIYFLDNLKPKTGYTFRLKIVYVDPDLVFAWPPDNRFTFRTLGDRPSRPGRPVMQHLSSGAYQVAWEPSRDNGAPVTLYTLEGRKSNPAKRGTTDPEAVGGDNVTHLWTLYYNGSDNYWVMNSELKWERLRFRVRSLNSYGWSEYSDSGLFDLSQSQARLAASHDVAILLWVLTPIAVFITVLLFICVLYRTRSNPKKTIVVSGDTELATLRELPRWSVQNTNILYSGASCQPPRSLPRDQITLTKFLGSGAFGEVFEGLAAALPATDGRPTRVAVKTLRKGASSQEKGEFLKEAQLMSNFRHPHILQLLGVCLDNDPHFIIMELMEGGDLLSYLRSTRPPLSAGVSLDLCDLVGMCTDVARGCCYLEEMHFVHRDLACRNCLVSSKDPLLRLVKIGDFGLARDIYKNDYYRKEGEGLLPVRWMAPESLVDGVFTSQSDVWAFGVLLWEIMSLGQQPYPARNNLEVLHYVRQGGRLGQPTSTPPDLYGLMMRCWSFKPEERPTFKYCLDVLVDLKERQLDHVASRPPLSEGEGNKPADPPKYLELLYDDTGGYEVPRSLEVSPEEDKSSLDKLIPHSRTEQS